MTDHVSYVYEENGSQLAACKCGLQGPNRADEFDAAHDGLTHDYESQAEILDERYSIHNTAAAAHQATEDAIDERQYSARLRSGNHAWGKCMAEIHHFHY